MLIYFIGIAVCMFIMWVSIIHFIGERFRLFLARHQWILFLVHIPVMVFFSMIGGDGMIFASASFIGGIAGQFYLSVWGMNRGLTLFGRKTAQYKPIVKVKKPKLRHRIDLAVTNKLLGQ